MASKNCVNQKTEKVMKIHQEFRESNILIDTKISRILFITILFGKVNYFKNYNKKIIALHEIFVVVIFFFLTLKVLYGSP